MQNRTFSFGAYQPSLLKYNFHFDITTFEKGEYSAVARLMVSPYQRHSLSAGKKILKRRLALLGIDRAEHCTIYFDQGMMCILPPSGLPLKDFVAILLSIDKRQPPIITYGKYGTVNTTPLSDNVASIIQNTAVNHFHFEIYSEDKNYEFVIKVLTNPFYGSNPQENSLRFQNLLKRDAGHLIPTALYACQYSSDDQYFYLHIQKNMGLNLELIIQMLQTLEKKFGPIKISFADQKTEVISQMNTSCSQQSNPHPQQPALSRLDAKQNSFDTFVNQADHYSSGKALYKSSNSYPVNNNNNNNMPSPYTNPSEPSICNDPSCQLNLLPDAPAFTNANQNHLSTNVNIHSVATTSQPNIMSSQADEPSKGEPTAKLFRIGKFMLTLFPDRNFNITPFNPPSSNHLNPTKQ
ncbi:MAG: hypothetical protein H0W64_05660 [Gammaproteobacteria bacterium]|nr:hypothetical protein [Gammaproteobacteria bacterium]